MDSDFFQRMVTLTQFIKKKFIKIFSNKAFTKINLIYFIVIIIIIFIANSPYFLAPHLMTTFFVLFIYIHNDNFPHKMLENLLAWKNLH